MQPSSSDRIQPGIRIRCTNPGRSGAKQIVANTCGSRPNHVGRHKPQIHCIHILKGELLNPYEVNALPDRELTGQQIELQIVFHRQSSQELRELGDHEAGGDVGAVDGALGGACAAMCFGCGKECRGIVIA